MEEPIEEENWWKKLTRGRRNKREVKPVEQEVMTNAEAVEVMKNLKQKAGTPEMDFDEADVKNFGRLMASGIEGQNIWPIWYFLGEVQIAYGRDREGKYEDYNEPERQKLQVLLGKNMEVVAKFVEAELTHKNGGTWSAEEAEIVVEFLCGSKTAEDEPLWKVMDSRGKETFGLLQSSNDGAYEETAFLWLSELLKRENSSSRKFAEEEIGKVVEGDGYGERQGMSAMRYLTGFRGDENRAYESRQVVRGLFKEEVEQRGWGWDRTMRLMIGNEISGNTNEWQRLWLNMQIMKQIENRVPDGVERLKSEWNIELFYRYGAEYWIDMLKGLDDKSQKWVLVVSAKVDDGPNGGALVNQRGEREFGLSTTWRKLQESGIAMRTLQVENEDQLELAAKMIAKLGYALADGFIVDAHGLAGSFRLGNWEEGEITVEEILNGVWKIKAVVKPGAPGVSTSCLGGTPRNPGEKSVVEALGEQTGARELDGQKGSGGWNEISPRIENGELMGFDTKPTTEPVEYRQ